MIQFATPWLLGVGVVGVMLTTALHFLSVQRPPELLLPTARFLAVGQTRAVARSARPSDWLLLLARTLLLLLACVALAGPRWASSDIGAVRLVVADGALRTDSARLLKDLNLRFDDAVTTRVIWTDTAMVTGYATGIRTSIASAIPTAIRTAAALTTSMPGVDSFSLHIVAPATSWRRDAAWSQWRAQWPGAIRVHEVATGRIGSSPTQSPGRSVLRAVPEAAVDPVRMALEQEMRRQIARPPAPERPDTVLLLRGNEQAVDPARPHSGVLIRWPENGVPAGWRLVRDSSAALVADGLALMSRWSRAAIAPDRVLQGTRAIAWWDDGAVAATEHANGIGCTRTVGVQVPVGRDVLFDPNARGLIDVLLAPCWSLSGATRVNWTVAVDSAGTAGNAAAPAGAFAQDVGVSMGSTPRWLSPMLLLASLLLLGFESWWRRRGDAESSDSSDARRSVA